MKKILLLLLLCGGVVVAQVVPDADQLAAVFDFGTPATYATNTYLLAGTNFVGHTFLIVTNPASLGIPTNAVSVTTIGTNNLIVTVVPMP